MPCAAGTASRRPSARDASASPRRAAPRAAKRRAGGFGGSKEERSPLGVGGWRHGGGRLEDAQAFAAWAQEQVRVLRGAPQPPGPLSAPGTGRARAQRQAHGNAGCTAGAAACSSAARGGAARPSRVWVDARACARHHHCGWRPEERSRPQTRPLRGTLPRASPTCAALLTSLALSLSLSPHPLGTRGCPSRR